jgi:hypothetical protein
MNPALCDEKPASNCLSYGIAFKSVCRCKRNKGQLYFQIGLTRTILRNILLFHCLFRVSLSGLLTFVFLQCLYCNSLLGSLLTSALQTDKGIPTRTLCQNNQGTVKIEQKPVAMGDRTTHRILSPERTPFQNGINGKSHL